MRPALLLLLLLAGCKTAASDAVRADGEVLNLPELVRRVNANNERLPSMVARGYLEAVIVEEAGGDGRYVNGAVNVLHLKPGRLLIKADKDAIGGLFELGTDGKKLWFHDDLNDVAYVGTIGNLDPRAAAELPLRPDLVLQVLGVNLLQTDLTKFPAPLLEVDPQNGLMMVRFVEPAVLGVPRLRVSKQVWYELPAEPGGLPLPRKVILSDDDGNAVLLADVGDFTRVGGDDGPVVARRFGVFLPQTGSKLRIELDRLALRDGRGFRAVPNERTFAFDPAARRMESVVDLDRPGDAGS